METVRQKYLPRMYEWFGEVEDSRHPSYVEYEMQVILGMLLYKNIVGLESMRSMTENFEKEGVIKNIYRLIGMRSREYLPHHQTVNEALRHIDPVAIEEINQEIVYQLIRRRSFEDARFQKKWLVIVDGTTTYSGKVKINQNCLERRHNKGTEEENATYYHAVLEAKIYFGGNLVCSIGSEFIENNGEDYENQKRKSAEAIKQDCELKAFKRLAEKLKMRFPRLPICILGDSLYASETVMDICRENSWSYILRYKSGSIPSIEEEYELIPEKGTAGKAEYVNKIGYRKHEVNVLRYSTLDKKGRKIQFQFLTNIPITKRNAEKMAEAGRCRWKIENQAFKRQKREVGDITHACSWNAQALKVHYLMQQIADFLRRLYERDFLAKLGIVKTQKKISSDFLQSLSQLAETEDTFRSDKVIATALC